jgi:AcrR family transcriptional regulator
MSQTEGSDVAEGPESEGREAAAGAATAAPASPSSTAAAGERTRVSSRAKLIDAALEEFATKGYEAATVAGIAERAGVTTGALYAHFDGKLDLLVATMGVRSPNEFMRTVIEAATNPWNEVVELLGRELSTRPDRRSLLGLDVIVVARRDPQVAKTLRRNLDTYLDAMERATDMGVEAGILDPPLASRDVARLFALVSFGMLIFTALGEESPSQAAFDRMIDLLLQSEGDHDDEAQPAALARVRSRATAADRARRQLHEGIAEAVAAGHSLRQVGGAAGLSHERVRRLLQERPTDSPVGEPAGAAASEAVTSVDNHDQ